MSDDVYSHSPFTVLDKPLSKFYSGWTRAPWVIVVHYSAGYNAETCYKVLGKRGLSTHATIERDGTIWKHLSDSNRGIHAGYGRWGGVSDMNHHALGFEIANLGPLDGLADSHMRRKAYDPQKHGVAELETEGETRTWYRNEMGTNILTRTTCAKFRDHRAGQQGKLWSVYPQKQIEAVFWLIWKWSQRYGILPENIIGHEHCTPHRKQDPGPAFPWVDLQEFLEDRYAASMPEMLDPNYKQKFRIKAVQSHLARLGLSVGDIDGLWGAATLAAAREAFRKYGDFYGLHTPTLAANNCYEIACALRQIPGFDPGRS